MQAGICIGGRAMARPYCLAGEGNCHKGGRDATCRVSKRIGLYRRAGVPAGICFGGRAMARPYCLAGKTIDINVVGTRHVASANGLGSEGGHLHRRTRHGASLLGAGKAITIIMVGTRHVASAGGWAVQAAVIRREAFLPSQRKLDQLG